MEQVTQTSTWRTKVGDVRPREFFRKPQIRVFNAKMITQIRNTGSNCVRTLKTHQDGGAPRLNRPALATGGQPLMSRGTMGHKCTTTVYN